MTQSHSFILMAPLTLALGCGAAVPPASPATPVADAETPAPVVGPDPADSRDVSELEDAPWWNTPYPEPFDTARLAKRPSTVRVEGNHFVDAAGETLIFQGVSIADPDKLSRDGNWSRELFEVVASWGANVVRVPVHPAAWRGRGRVGYLELLDQAVTWSNELDLYVIIDWHSIGNLRTELFQHPMYDTTQRETFEFWRTIAFRYRGVATTAFYELFNEPTRYNGTLGAISWTEWKAINEELIDVIRAHDDQVIPLVAGFNWGYELRSVAEHPIERDGIAYVAHPYPMKTTAPFAQNWDEAFGHVAERYPLFATEIGYMRAGQKGAHDPVIDDGSYGPRITDYLAARGASWVAWCFHPEWSPMLISDWDFTPTESGEHFRKVMLGRQGAGQ